MPIGAVTTSAASASLNANSLGIQDFLKILSTQLIYQDPLKPMDNQAFMAQIAQFTSLEQTQQLNNKIETLISNQSALQSVGLIGRTVDIATSTGNVTGTVTALSLSGESPVISVLTSTGLNITDVSLGQITLVR